MEAFRTEEDAIGPVQLPIHCLWGAQTERSRINFPFHECPMSYAVIKALVLIKKAACLANYELHLLPKEKKEVIIQAIDEILADKWKDQFPLSVFQTGSGTHTNMNVNEVIANRAIQLSNGVIGSKFPIHSNDDVNKSQSSNDTFPAAIHIATIFALEQRLLPALREFHQGLTEKSNAFSQVMKIGRTHLMDAVPMTLGQEFSGYASQIAHAIDAITKTLPALYELPLGATAVGTGINCHPQFAQKAIEHLVTSTQIPFVQAPNLFQGLSSHEAIVFCSGAVKTAACALFKIANDIRLMASGPRTGLLELTIPANEPGSSIMPGKVNPTQCEALTMIVAQVIGCDAAITFAGTQGQFELNVFKPVIAHNLLLAISLLTDGVHSFYSRCIEGITPNTRQLQYNVDSTLMIATALTPHIGYDRAVEVVQKAFSENKTVKEAVIELQLLTAEEFDQIKELTLRQN